MLLFKPEHVQPILDGRKTQTRRIWKRCRVLVGSIHQCYTRPAWAKPPGKPLFSVLITGHRVERLGDISDADALAEGYAGVEDYHAAFARINRKKPDGCDMNAEVHVVDFELVDVLPVPDPSAW